MIEAFTVAAILLGCLCVVLKWADRERAEEEEETPVQFTIDQLLAASRAGDYGPIWPMSDTYCDWAGLPRDSYFRIIE